jgi:hypothetical protein
MLTSISAGCEAFQQTFWKHSPSFQAQTSVHVPSLLAVAISPMFQLGIARAVRISEFF